MKISSLIATTFIRIIASTASDASHIEKFLIEVDAYNTTADIAMSSCIDKNKYNQYIQLTFNKNKNSYKILIMAIKHLLVQYHLIYKCPPIDSFSLNFMNEKICQQKFFLFYLIQTHCRLHFNIDENELTCDKTINFNSIRFRRRAIYLPDGFDYLQKIAFNFYTLTNCLVSIDDFRLFYRIMSTCNELQKIKKNTLYVLFALKFDSEAQLIKWNNLQVYEVFRTKYCSNPKYNIEIYHFCIENDEFKHNFVTKFSIEESYIYNDIPKSKNSIKSEVDKRFNLSTFFAYSFKLLQDVFYFLTKRSSNTEIVRLKGGLMKYDFEIRSILKTIKIIIVVDENKTYAYKNNNTIKKLEAMHVSIYRIHEQKILLYKRFFQIRNDAIKKLQNADDFGILFTNMSNMFVTFKKNLFAFSNVGLIQYSQFLPSKNVFELFRYPLWNFISTGCCNHNQIDKKMSYRMLFGLYKHLKNLFKKNGKITLMSAKLSKSSICKNYNYCDNVFNICDVEYAMQEHEFTDVFFRNIKILILAIQIYEMENQTCYALFPIGEYRLFVIIGYLNNFWDMFSKNQTALELESTCIEIYLSVKNVVYDCIFKQVDINFIDYDFERLFDYIYNERRVCYFIILHNARNNFYLSDYTDLILKELSWLENKTNYKCIIQSKKFSKIMEKHKMFSRFREYKALSLTYLKVFQKFCRSIPKISIKEDLNIFWFFQIFIEVEIGDSSAIVFHELKDFIFNFPVRN